MGHLPKKNEAIRMDEGNNEVGRMNGGALIHNIQSSIIANYMKIRSDGLEISPSSLSRPPDDPETSVCGIITISGF